MLYGHRQSDELSRPGAAHTVKWGQSSLHTASAPDSGCLLTMSKSKTSFQYSDSLAFCVRMIHLLQASPRLSSLLLCTSPVSSALIS